MTSGLQQTTRVWPLIHLRHDGRARCGLTPPESLLTDDWLAFTCPNCLVPWQPAIWDPR